MTHTTFVRFEDVAEPLSANEYLYGYALRSHLHSVGHRCEHVDCTIPSHPGVQRADGDLSL